MYLTFTSTAESSSKILIGPYSPDTVLYNLNIWYEIIL